MIAASRRRRPGVIGADEAFRLHLRMARRASWSTRLRRGSLLALLASVVALFAGAELAVHLLACAAAFGAGLALPVPGSEGAALAEIRSVAGLSYETALDLLERATATKAEAVSGPSEADPYGFRSAVVDRARLSVNDIRPASPPAWWLPALAVALALVLFGALERPFAGGSGGGGSAGGPSGGASGPAAPGAAQEGVEQEPELNEAEPEVERAEEPEGAGGAAEDRAAESSSSAPPGELGDSSEPMSRFLDSLRERPPEAGDPGQGEDGSPQAGREAEGLGDPAEESQGPGSQEEGEPQRAELRSSESATGEEQGQQEGTASESGEQTGAAASEQDAAGAESEDGGPEAGEEQGDELAAGAQQDGAAEEQVAQPGGEEGMQPDAGEGRLESGDEGGESSDSQDAGGAGAAGGAEQAAGVAEGGQERPEFLEGVLESGPENQAGTVRLPGSGDVALPPGRSLTDYQNAAEDALTEGDLPLSYQEIIRRYFR